MSYEPHCMFGNLSTNISSPRKHGGGAEHAGVSGRHDGGGNCAQAEERHEVGRQVLQHQRQDHGRLVGGQLAVWRQVAAEVRLVPSCIHHHYYYSLMPTPLLGKPSLPYATTTFCVIDILPSSFC